MKFKSKIIYYLVIFLLVFVSINFDYQLVLGSKWFLTLMIIIIAALLYVAYRVIGVPKEFLEEMQDEKDREDENDE